jgi:hypothetical protein
MERRDRIIRLAKLRGDRAALAIMEAKPRQRDATWTQRHALTPFSGSWMTPFKWDQLVAAETESELRAMWGDR